MVDNGCNPVLILQEVNPAANYNFDANSADKNISFNVFIRLIRVIRVKK